MFGTKTAETDAGPVTHSGPVKVLKLNLKLEKDEAELASWLSLGWKLSSTEAVSVNGTTLFILAFLERRR